MSRVVRWVPWLVIVTAVGHLIYAAVEQTTWAGIASQGVWNTVNGQPEREADLWLLVAGPALLLIGLLARTIVRTTGTLPLSFGLGMIMLGALVCVPTPVSGGWLILLIGGLSCAATMITASSANRAHAGQQIVVQRELLG